MEDLKEQFKKEHGYSPIAVRQDYAGQTPYEDGFCDEYVIWLENKIKLLESPVETQKEVLLSSFLDISESKADIVLIQSKDQIIKNFLS